MYSNKNVKIKKWPIIIAVILFFLYLLALDPSTGFFGGIAFILIESWGPSVANILAAYWLASIIVKKFSIKQMVLMIALSALLGLNIMLLSRMISEVRSVKVTVIKPLALPNQHSFFVYYNPRNNTTIKTLSAYRYFPETNATIAPFFFNVFHVEFSEGCGCMYFHNIPSVYTNDSIGEMLNEYFTYVISDFNDKIDNKVNSPNYKVVTSSQKVSKEVLFKMNITDNYGGKVLISEVYPGYFYAKSIKDYNKSYDFSTNYSVLYAINTFIYGNFWAAIFDKYLQAPMIEQSVLRKHTEIFSYRKE